MLSLRRCDRRGTRDEILIGCSARSRRSLSGTSLKAFVVIVSVMRPRQGRIRITASHCITRQRKSPGGLFPPSVIVAAWRGHFIKWTLYKVIKANNKEVACCNTCAQALETQCTARQPFNTGLQCATGFLLETPQRLRRLSSCLARSGGHLHLTTWRSTVK